jgi:DUF1680 family protein
MEPMNTTRRIPSVEFADPFWAPRLEQLSATTLPVLLQRLTDHGVVAAFDLDTGRRGLWFSDSDLYKWMEAAASAGRLDLLEPIVAIVAESQHSDGYLNSYYDRGPSSPGRYVDLANSHEWYCGGHLIEAALAHHDATGERTLLDVAIRWADHLCSTFGPGRDERIDGHPEVELALVRLARATADHRYLEMARWIIERTVDLATVDLAGHAVRAIYLASAIAEVAISTGDAVYTAAATRLWRTMVDERSYPTGAVGGRWLGESVGRPFELGDDTSYTESCAAVAALQFAWRMWLLTESTSCLDHLELILYNAVAAGVGSDGETWFYSQPHAYSGDGESNPWVSPHDFGASMMLSWFPPKRHGWFDVTCCPTNLVRAFSGIGSMVADIEGSHLRIHLPVACRITDGEWDVEVRGRYPWDGTIEVIAHSTPVDGRIAVRVPAWAGGKGHRDITVTPRLELPVRPEWWETDPRVSGARGTVFLRGGPVVYCVEAATDAGYDLRAVVVQLGQALDERDAPMLAGGVRVIGFRGRILPTDGGLYRRLGSTGPPTGDVELMAIPYAANSNRRFGQMTVNLRH